MGQEIKILDLKENPGILPIKLGPAKIQTSAHHFIHYYNLTPIAQEIDAIQNQYEAVAIAINNGLSRPYWTNLQNFIQGLQFEAVHRNIPINIFITSKKKSIDQCPRQHCVTISLYSRTNKNINPLLRQWNSGSTRDISDRAANWIWIWNTTRRLHQLQKSNQRKTTDLPKIQTVPVHPKEEIKPIHLEKIPLDELHKLHDIQDHMTPLFYEQDSDYTHLWTTPVYITIAASVGILWFKYYHCLPWQKKATTTPPSEPPVLFVPYKTSSGDGEVTK
ncbi:hypothetical protein JTB14_031934 [Gonioctena quinquepunctata]|nr:hypothetical protein JTB14_031934 [Gonioctena quinquepunctata]